MIHCVFRLSFLSLSRTSLYPLTVMPYSRPSGSCPSCSPFCTSSPERWSRPPVESGYEASHRGASICQRSPSIHRKVLGCGWGLPQWAMKTTWLGPSLEGLSCFAPSCLFLCSHGMNTSALPTCSLPWCSSPYAQGGRTKNTRRRP